MIYVIEDKDFLFLFSKGQSSNRINIKFPHSDKFYTYEVYPDYLENVRMKYKKINKNKNIREKWSELNKLAKEVELN